MGRIRKTTTIKIRGLLEWLVARTYKYIEKGRLRDFKQPKIELESSTYNN